MERNKNSFSVIEDENAMQLKNKKLQALPLSQKSFNSFTPQKTKAKKRVILGDISNREQQQNQSFKKLGNKSNTHLSQQKRVVLGDISNRKQQHSQKKNSFKSNKQKGSFRSSSFSISSTSFEDELSINNQRRNKSRTKNSSSLKDGILYQNSSFNKQKSILRTKGDLKIEIDGYKCDDIERTAGRMWHEQEHSDDETNCSFDIEGCKEDINQALSQTKKSRVKTKIMAEDSLLMKDVKEMIASCSAFEENEFYENEYEGLGNLLPPYSFRGGADNEFRLDDINF